MRIWCSLLLCFLGIPFLAKAQMNPVKFERYTLSNGLKVILHEDHSTPIAVVSVLYHVGSKNENPERTGFAHFFEHLLFEGSANVGRGEFDKYLSGAGGQNNANTSQDRTYYYEVLPSNQLPLALWLESERMLHAKIEPKGIETQRQVVKEERRQRIDNQPYGRFLEEMALRLFKTHPYRWTPIGSMEHLDRATESDYVNFYKDFYVPNNAVLTIAGDFNPALIKPMIEKYFSTIPKSTRPIYRPTVVEAPLGKELRDTIYDKVQLPGVFLAYRTPAQTDPDFYALEMLNRLLSGGQSSRIYKALVDEKQVAVAAQSVSLPLEQPGATIILGIANLGAEPSKVEEALDFEIEKVKTALVPETEFQKLRNQLEANLVDENSTLLGIAENLANFEVYYGDANLINTNISRYLKVTREDLQRVAKKYLDKNNRVVLYWLPEQKQ
ncbi:M16 family metallopeptidase [Haliscomenobacter hydrossis]|uniref:Processing peptidase n=1 Tax=Haliscomenobacter hydrossis (strain ATCC 27775 / DSM 1100 / LMG 10767 / O) TaxID=760192 RepID=F4L3H9_HALH1|nr:pitrilysin family protein [Haliscomenobacter hydrossis]AEE52956.1 processing peptidase [Haliscomenobacter hydrossis DSM 1100]